MFPDITWFSQFTV